MRKVVLIGLMAALLVGAGVAVFVVGGGDGGGGGGSSTTVARRNGAAVTEADNGGQVTVPRNQPFVLDLKGSPDAPWGLPLSQATSLAIVSSKEQVDGSVSATFIPLDLSPGVVVTAVRGGTSTERFEVTIRVEG